MHAQASPDEREQARARRAARRAQAARPAKVALAGALVPGLGHMMLGRTAAGAGVLGGTLGLLGGSVALDPDGVFSPSSPTAALTQGASALWLWSVWDAYQSARVHGQPAPATYPYQGPLELLGAPFDPGVLRQPDLLLPLLVVGAIAASQNHFGSTRAVWHQRQLPLLGHAVPTWAGVAADEAAFATVSLEAAVGEESTFRGLLLHALGVNQRPALAIGLQATLFGLMHFPNPFLFSDGATIEDGIETTLVTGLLGAHLGYLTYSHTGDLRPAIAFHFWYNFILLTSAFVSSPDSVPFRLQIGFPI